MAPSWHKQLILFSELFTIVLLFMYERTVLKQAFIVEWKFFCFVLSDFKLNILTKRHFQFLFQTVEFKNVFLKKFYKNHDKIAILMSVRTSYIYF